MASAAARAAEETAAVRVAAVRAADPAEAAMVVAARAEARAAAMVAGTVGVKVEAERAVAVREVVKAVVREAVETVEGAQGVARGRVRTERAEAEATGQEILAVVVTVAEAMGRVIREREEAEVTGQAKAEAEATGEVGPLRLPTCFARLLLQAVSAVFDWLALAGARSVRGGALVHLYLSTACACW